RCPARATPPATPTSRLLPRATLPPPPPPRLDRPGAESTGARAVALARGFSCASSITMESAGRPVKGEAMSQSIADSHNVDIAEYPYDPQPPQLPFEPEGPAKPLANFGPVGRGWIIAIALTAVFCVVD